MIQVLPLSKKVKEKIKKFNLTKKFTKQLKLFSENPCHPSLNTELLLPKEYGIYSFRINRKFRALFIYRDDKKSVELINISSHYQQVLLVGYIVEIKL